MVQQQLVRGIGGSKLGDHLIHISRLWIGQILIPTFLKSKGS